MKDLSAKVDKYVREMYSNEGICPLFPDEDDIERILGYPDSTDEEAQTVEQFWFESYDRFRRENEY